MCCKLNPLQSHAYSGPITVDKKVKLPKSCVICGRFDEWFDRDLHDTIAHQLHEGPLQAVRFDHTVCFKSSQKLTTTSQTETWRPSSDAILFFATYCAIIYHAALHTTYRFAGPVGLPALLKLDVSTKFSAPTGRSKPELAL